MRAWLACLPAGLTLALALAHPALHAQGIYTCTDAKGRKLTADRPILDCIDREQKEITPSGTVVRKLGPSLTAQERAAEEERARAAAEERARVVEEKRRDRALLTRYPDRAVHDKERAAALATADEVIAAANGRLRELQAQRKKLNQELEFYKGDASKVPLATRRQMEELDQQAQAQSRFIANQQEEKKRISTRYDEELLRLKALWAQQYVAPAAAAASAKR